MITKDELIDLLGSTETYRVEKTTSTGNMDKFCEAICAFANDLPDSRKKGYLILGAYDDGKLSGLKVDDALLKKIAAIRSDGNILPLCHAGKGNRFFFRITGNIDKRPQTIPSFCG